MLFNVTKSPVQCSAVQCSAPLIFSIWRSCQAIQPDIVFLLTFELRAAGSSQQSSRNNICS